MCVRNLRCIGFLFFLACAAPPAGWLHAQTDPGPRGGPAGAGNYYPGLNAAQQQMFSQAMAVFQEVDSVAGGIPGEPGSGLGPTFNGNSCAMCHAQPAVGGSSPGLKSKQNSTGNPQIALATLHGATNKAPSFITIDGPVREARFVTDGGVHALFTIQGRSDSQGCTLAQPDFSTELANHNVVFRIPTPTFGLGLVEATPDAVLIANLLSDQKTKSAMGISGRFNIAGNDGTITRFGWKAQNKSLLIFAGEAYNVEQGVSNELFPNQRSAIDGCAYNPGPEDATPIGDPQQVHSDTINFANFMRLSTDPTPTTASASELNGQSLFGAVGCALCHSPSLTTGPSRYGGMSNSTYHPYSDFALHAMGSGLADGISQGTAAVDEFRTAPLWGVGQRLFFLHDGRTADLMQAIQAHAAIGADCGPSANHRPAPANQNCSSEANAVIAAFNALTVAQKQDLLNFLRSL
jgi:CxxC motif-containing protein (DUF1111 family)